MEKIELIRPIHQSGNINDLKESDLVSIHSNIFSDFNNKSGTSFDKANKEVFNILKYFPSFSEFLEKNKKNYNDFEVIIPKEILEKLKSGDYILNKKKGTEEFLAFVKDRKSNNIIKQLRLKEITQTEKLNNLLPSLQNMAVLQSLNQLSRQLEQIEEKLITIHQEFNNDRIGKIQAGFGAYLDALQMTDKDNRNKALFSAHNSLNIGRSQLIESAKQRLSKIETGFFRSFFKEVFSVNFKKSQRDNLKEFAKELFYIQRASQIILTTYQEIDEPQAMIQSMAPFLDLMRSINDEKNLYKIGEWNNSSINWEQISDRIIKSIESIPSYRKLDNSDYILNLQP